MSVKCWWTAVFCLCVGMTAAAEDPVGYDEVRGRLAAQLPSGELLVRRESADEMWDPAYATLVDLATGEMVTAHEWAVGDELTAFVRQDSLRESSGDVTAPQVIGLGNDAAYTMDLDYFDRNGEGKNGRLILNGLPKSVSDREGKPVREADVLGNELLVLYTTATRSIPPQTTPERVTVWHAAVSQEPKEMLNIVLIDPVTQDGTTYYPLRATLERAGAQVGWRDGRVTVRWQEREATLDVAKNTLRYENETERIDGLFLRDGVTYATRDVFERLSAQLS